MPPQARQAMNSRSQQSLVKVAVTVRPESHLPSHLSTSAGRCVKQPFISRACAPTGGGEVLWAAACPPAPAITR